MKKILASAAVLLVLASPALAKDDNAGNSHKPACRKSHTTVARFTFTPAVGFETANIKAGLSDNSQSCGTVTTISKFNGKVRLPIPTAGLSITDTVTAKAAKLHYVFSRAGVDYADCTFSADAGEDENSTSLDANYRLSLDLKRNGTVKLKKGACDTDLATAGVQSAIPSVKTGDTVRAEAEVSAARVVFANATL